MIKKYLPGLFVALFMAIAVLAMPSLSLSVHAQTPTGSGINCSSGNCVDKGLGDVRDAFPSGATTEKDVPELIHKVINWALYLAGILAVIFIIYGGFLYITSAGNDAQAKTGRAALQNALIGLVIVVLSYMIVQIVYNFLVD